MQVYLNFNKNARITQKNPNIIMQSEKLYWIVLEEQQKKINSSILNSMQPEVSVCKVTESSAGAGLMWSPMSIGGNLPLLLADDLACYWEVWDGVDGEVSANWRRSIRRKHADLP